jgi:amino acid adenylation domain-containing protein
MEAQLAVTLNAFNRTATEDLLQKSAHELFEAQVERHPEAPAVSCKGRQFSYRELNERANQLAHYLRKLGVGRETLVSVCLERSLEMVVGLLAVWKAGGAYVPLDPVYPAERLEFMVQDSGARVLLTNQKCQQLLRSCQGKALLLDSDWGVVAEEPSSNPVSLTNGSNLAYVMYTSGSTGKPKGAMILHKGLVNYLLWAADAYHVGPGGTVPVHSSISFDLTVTSLYTPLIAGAQVELLPDGIAGEHLLAALRSVRKHTLIKITPAHLDMLTQLLKPEEFARVTNVFVIGGEALLAENLSAWRKLAPDTRLINEYGPTETVVGCCVYQVQPEDPISGAVPIGRPIANTQLYVLDEKLRPVPTGAIGELYIGGAGVGRGYWNRPELTQEAFLPDPFSDRPDAHLYKTGDLTRYRENGILEYLGRVDNQVKVHGYRIELGEIEAALTTHPELQSCAVIAHEFAPGDKQLVAYVVARSKERPGTDALREYLEQKLPKYMVPARFMFLDALPLTTNGKVDRKGLPDPTFEEVLSSEEFVAPRTPVEEKIVAIWCELLGVQKLGIHDDVFLWGAHSLMAVRAISRIQSALNLTNAQVSLTTLLQAPTVAELAAVIEEAKQKPALKKSNWIRA